MLIIKDIPLIPLQTAIFKLIKEGQDKPIYGSVDDHTTLPYITFGSINFKNISVKNNTMWTASVQLDVWGSSDDKQVINDILNDMSVLLSVKGEQLDVQGYSIINVVVDFAEVWPEDTYGYHGVLTTLFQLQKI